MFTPLLRPSSPETRPFGFYFTLAMHYACGVIKNKHFQAFKKWVMDGLTHGEIN